MTLILNKPSIHGAVQCIFSKPKKGINQNKPAKIIIRNDVPVNRPIKSLFLATKASSIDFSITFQYSLVFLNIFFINTLSKFPELRFI
jgi:hypothetical protein